MVGSHSGLGHNPLAMAVIADRLAQPVGAWSAYEVPSCLGPMVRLGPVPDSSPHLVAAA